MPCALCGNAAALVLDHPLTEDERLLFDSGTHRACLDRVEGKTVSKRWVGSSVLDRQVSASQCATERDIPTDAGRTGWRIPTADRGDEIQATCWCDKRVVWITLADVIEGRTESCGHPRCRPPS